MKLPVFLARFAKTLVSWCTTPVAYLAGLLPSPGSLLAILVAAGIVVAANITWASIIVAAPALAIGALVAGLNFWYAREIQEVILGLTRTVPDDGQGKKFRYHLNLKEEYDLEAAVTHLRSVMGVRYGELPPEVRLGTFAEHHYKIVVAGRNPGKSIIALSTGAFELFEGRPKLLQAILLQSLAQIKIRATFSGAVLGVVSDFAELLNSFKTAEFLPYQVLGYIATPLAKLLTYSLSRTNFYYRADRIVAECGHGQDLIEALDLINNAFQASKTDYVRRDFDQPRTLNRWSFSYWFPRVANMLKGDGQSGEDKNGHAFFDILDNLVLRGGLFIKELFSPAPRMGHRKAAIKEYMEAEATKDACQLIEIPVDHAGYYKFCDPKYSEPKKAGGHHHHHFGFGIVDEHTDEDHDDHPVPLESEPLQGTQNDVPKLKQVPITQFFGPVDRVAAVHQEPANNNAVLLHAFGAVQQQLPTTRSGRVVRAPDFLTYTRHRK